MALILDYDTHLAVERDGLPRVAGYDDGSQHVLYLDGSVVRSLTAAEWLSQRGPLPTVPTQPEIDAALAAREAARQQAGTEAAALRQQVLTLAQSAVGVGPGAWTTPQMRALLAILLWREGALKNDLTVRPLAEWVKG